jgi:hypothetical protein
VTPTASTLYAEAIGYRDMEFHFLTCSRAIAFAVSLVARARRRDRRDSGFEFSQVAVRLALAYPAAKTIHLVMGVGDQRNGKPG